MFVLGCPSRNFSSTPETYLAGDVRPWGDDITGDGDSDDAGEFGDNMVEYLYPKNFNTKKEAQAFMAKLNLETKK